MLKVSNPFSNIPPLFSDLANLLAGDITFDKNDISASSYDFSPYTVQPQTIIYPKNSTDIKHVISFSREYLMPLTVRGNGGSGQGGSLGEGIILDMTRYFTHIRQINMLDHTITVDAGVSIKELRERLHGWNMDIPVLTSQDDHMTVGGILATKNCSPTSFYHGSIRDWVEAITLVVDTGEEHRIAEGITPSGRLLGIYQSVFPLLTDASPILRASKPENHDDSTGYCLWGTSIGPRQLLDQIAGSEGTLGIITTVTLRLIPYKSCTEIVSVAISDKELLSVCINIAKHHKAEHIYFYNATLTELITRYEPSFTSTFHNEDYVLTVTFFGNNREVVQTKAKLFCSALPVEEEYVHTSSSRSFIDTLTKPSFHTKLLSMYTKNSHKEIRTCDGIIVPLSNFSKALQSFENYLYTTGKLYIITGNAASGHISLITLFDPNSPTFEHDIETYTQSIFAFVKKYKGGIGGRNGEGVARTPYLSMFFNEATLAVFAQIKAAWDPLSLFNPGKKTGTTLTYLRNHVSRRI